MAYYNGEKSLLYNLTVTHMQISSDMLNLSEVLDNVSERK